MLNYDNLNIIIDRYIADMPTARDEAHDEVFKWKAVKHFQDVWFSKEERPFAEKLTDALKYSDVLLNNGTMNSLSGIKEMLKKAPVEMKQLFTALFAEDNGNLTVRQGKMEAFVAAYHPLKEEYFPGKWRYNVDRNVASFLLAFLVPEQNYMYRWGTADLMCKCIQYEPELDSGDRFSLKDYYGMCDAIASHLRTREDLLASHAAYLDAACHEDAGLHILVYDLMHCTKAYNYDRGLYMTPEEKEVRRTQKAKVKLWNAFDEARDSFMTKQTELAGKVPFDLKRLWFATKEHGRGIIVEQTLRDICVEYSDGTRVRYNFTWNAQMDMQLKDGELVFAELASISALQQELTRLKAKMEELLEELSIPKVLQGKYLPE